MALTAAPYSTLMPAVVHEAFDGNSQTLGFLVGAAGCGAVCGTLHGPHDECPGELRITQPERHGWRVLVSTGHRTEVYGVLIAPTRDCWRARILRRSWRRRVRLSTGDRPAGSCRSTGTGRRPRGSSTCSTS